MSCTGASFAELSGTLDGSCPQEALNVAIVAPSMGILGGQAVQADRLLRAWATDPEISAWLVPINPAPAGPSGGMRRISSTSGRSRPSCRTGRRSIRELRQADIVHVFSASYFSFLLAPLPAVAGRQAAGQAGRHELPERRGAGPPETIVDRADRRSDRVDRNAVPSSFLHDVFAAFGIRPRSSRISSIVELFRFRRRERARSSHPVDAELRAAVQRRLHAAGVPAVQDQYPDATLTLVGAGSRGPAVAPPRRRARPAARAVRRPGPAGEISTAITPTRTSTCRRPTSTTCHRRCSRPLPAAARSSRPMPGAFRPS